MSRLQKLLDEYGESHQNPVNKRVHWICVPAIIVSLLGLIWSIPVTEAMSQMNIAGIPMNWATLFIAFAMIYYFTLSVQLAIGMLLVVFLLAGTGYLLATLIPLPLWGTSLLLFTLAWIGQFWGHKIEGKKPSFLKDLQFLLIGPVWLLNMIYQRLGIRVA